MIALAISVKQVSLTPNRTTIGQTVTIHVIAEDVSWGTIKNEFQDWDYIKNNLNNWTALKNYTNK